MKETRKLPVTLTETELTERRDALATRDQERVKIELEKKAASRAFRERLKPVVEDITRISGEIISRTEVRDVECEVRDSLVNGQVEVVRLDTFEVIDTYMPGASVDDEPPNPDQPVLPFAAPVAPRLLCTAIDEDGVAYAVTAEQADNIERDHLAQGRLGIELPLVHALIDGADRRIICIRRGKACETCGVAGGHHRPECAGMKAEEGNDSETPNGCDDQVARDQFDADLEAHVAATNADAFERNEVEGYDRNDTAAVAAHIDGGARPNDAPLTPVGEDTKPLLTKVTPKRKKAAASEGGVSS